MEELGWSKKVAEYETKDIKILEDRYNTWLKKRTTEKLQQQEQRVKKEKLEELKQKLVDLQSHAELVTYFDNIKDMRYYQQFKKEEVVEEEEEEEFVEAPGERNVTKRLKKKK